MHMNGISANMKEKRNKSTIKRKLHKALYIRSLKNLNSEIDWVRLAILGKSFHKFTAKKKKRIRKSVCSRKKKERLLLSK